MLHDYAKGIPMQVNNFSLSVFGKLLQNTMQKMWFNPSFEHTRVKVSMFKFCNIWKIPQIKYFKKFNKSAPARYILIVKVYVEYFSNQTIHMYHYSLSLHMY